MVDPSKKVDMRPWKKVKIDSRKNFGDSEKKAVSAPDDFEKGSNEALRKKWL